jgi:DNA-binding CsgD family transcriptional regulator
MANIERTVSGPVFGLSRNERLLTDLEQGVVVLDRDGSAMVIGPSGAVVWTATAEQLHAAIRTMMADPSIDGAAIKKLATLRQLTRANMVAGLDLLSTRERQILELICCGLSDPDIAELLRLSRNTVRNHIASLYRKLRVNRRSAAVIWAHRQGFPGDGAWRENRDANPIDGIKLASSRPKNY